MTLFDKRRRPFEVRNYSPGDYPCLEEMYDTFEPKGKYQGMPPYQRTARSRWLQMLIRNGNNILAWQDLKVIGHVVVLPDFSRRDAEYLIFVLHFNRGLGIGSELSRKAIQRVGDLNIKTIWLTVDVFNFRATRLYKKFGFQFCEACDYESERMMILHL